MMRKILQKSVALWILIALFGCNPRPAAPTPLPPTLTPPPATVTPAPSPTPALTASPSPVPVEPTATLLPTPTALPVGFTILHEFGTQPGNGRVPYGVLVSADGFLFGTTTYGGPPYDQPPKNPDNKGNLFRLNLDGSDFRVLHEFHGGAEDGWKPWSGLALRDGQVYGSTVYGGPADEQGGTLYTLGADGRDYRLLHTFGGSGDGYGASTSPILVDDTLYGLTRWGGAGLGSLYAYSLIDGSYATLFRFPASGALGSYPLGTLVDGRDGFLYGLAWQGGKFNYGTFFRIRQDSAEFEVLHHFSGGEQGKYPYDTPVFDGGDTFYGTTLGEYGNDPSDLGVVFAFSLSDRSYRAIHRFIGGPSDSGKPNGSLVLSEDGNWLYGTTHGDLPWDGSEAGVLYQMRVDGSDFQILHEFSGGAAGDTPMRTPLLLDHALYGLTAYGGRENYGLIYRYQLP